jgi:hypothetical protein
VHTECSWCCSSVLRGPKVARPATFSNEPAPVSVGRWQASHRHPPLQTEIPCLRLGCPFLGARCTRTHTEQTGEFRPHD